MTLRSRIWSPIATPILGLGWEEGGMVSTGQSLSRPWLTYPASLSIYEPMALVFRWPSVERD